MRISFYQKNRHSVRVYPLYGQTCRAGDGQKNPLVVDYNIPIIEVSRQAMSRQDENLYDYVIVTHEKALFGAVSVRDLLLNFAEIQAVAASFLNPLTGLPGNISITEWMVKTLLQDEFSVLYIDLDHFKAYNDTYGFKEGDRMIQATAELLKHEALRMNGFLGHIGGDDFIIFLSAIITTRNAVEASSRRSIRRLKISIMPGIWLRNMC
ncbi:GGDEF domain-containing protein [Paenibacillus rhizoplanae]